MEGAGHTGVYRARHMAGAKAAFRSQFRVSATRDVSARVATLSEAELVHRVITLSPCPEGKTDEPK